MFNVKVVYPSRRIAEIAESVTDMEIESEKKNTKEFTFMGEFDSKIYNNSIKADITLKKWIEKHNLQAFGKFQQNRRTSDNTFQRNIPSNVGRNRIRRRRHLNGPVYRSAFAGL